MSDNERETPTDVAPARDTKPPGPADLEASRVLGTLLPPRAPKTLEDSYLDRAIRVVAEAGEDLRKGRQESHERHNAVLDAIRRSDENQTRNYEMVRDEIRKLKDSDRQQDAKLAEFTVELAKVTSRIDVIERAGVASAFQSDLRDVKDSVAMLIDAVASMNGLDKTALAGMRVLLVDDHDLIRKSLSRVLSSHGAAVLTAATFAAVKLMMDFDPDCVLVDLRLAEGEDGTAIVEWLLSTAGLAPSRVALLTGDDGPGPARAAARLGVQLLGKPLRAEELVRVVREASGSRPS